jgi:hypothetical protein
MRHCLHFSGDKLFRWMFCLNTSVFKMFERRRKKKKNKGGMYFVNQFLKIKFKVPPVRLYQSSTTQKIHRERQCIMHGYQSLTINLYLYSQIYRLFVNSEDQHNVPYDPVSRRHNSFRRNTNDSSSGVPRSLCITDHLCSRISTKSRGLENWTRPPDKDLGNENI